MRKSPLPDTRSSLSLRHRLLPAAPRPPRQGQGHRHHPLERPLRRRGPHLLDLRDLRPLGRRTRRDLLRQRAVRQPLLPRSAQRKVNAAFRAHLPKALRRRRKRPLRVIVDLTLIPYYGDHALDNLEIYRSEKKAGTRSFFAYATAYVLLHGQRFTLAVTPVTRSDLLKDVLQELLHLVSKAGLRPGLLLLDRGFYNAEIIKYLQRARRPFLMPVTCHGRGDDHPKGPGGSMVFKLMKKSGWFTHTVGDPKKKGRANARVSICVKRGRTTDRHGRKKWHTWVYAYWGITPKRVDWVKKTYRKRFGIETSYRQMNEWDRRDDDEEVQCAVLLRGDRSAAEEPVGLAASRDPVDAAARMPAVQLGSAAGEADAALAGASGRQLIWFGPHGRNRKGCATVGCDVTRRSRSFGKYWGSSGLESCRTRKRHSRMTPADLRAITMSVNDKRGTGGQSKLGRLLGWHHSTVWRKLNGKSKITKSDELAISRALADANPIP